MRLFLGLAAFLVTVTPASGQQTVTEQERSDRNAVEEHCRSVMAAFEQGDADAFMALSTEDVVLMPPGEASLSTREAVRALMEDFFAAFAVELESITIEEIVVAGDWAFLRDSYVSNLTPRSGGETSQSRGKNVWILRRTDGGSWKVARNMWNSSGTDADPQGG